MSTNIIERTIGGTPDKRLSLGNSRGARTMAILGSWTQLRIGIRVGVTSPSTANITGTPRLVMGVLFNTDNQYGNSAQHFLGIKTMRAIWTYRAGPPAHFFDGAGDSVRIAKVESGSETDGNVMTSVWGMPIVTEDIRFGIFLDIKKDTTWQMKMTWPSSGSGVQSDWSETDLLNAMALGDLADIATVKSDNSATAWINAPAIDEGTFGTLNSLQLSWDRSVQEMEFSDLRYRVVS